jgi:acyl-CoA synthetase (AMP-forming)/AMP-acid ligase II
LAEGSPVNISMLLDMAADGMGPRVIVGGGSQAIPLSGLQQRAAGAARLLTDSGASALVYLGVNGLALPVALFGAARAGVPLVPLNYRLGRDQLKGLLAQHPGAYCVADPAHLETVAALGLRAQTPGEFLVAAASANASVSDPPETDAPAVLIYTSGTTSEPKGVLLRHDHLVAYVLGTVEFAAADAEDAALMSVPPYHISAISNVLTNVYSGRRFLTLEPFTPEGWLELVRSEAITNAMVVPTMLARIMDTPGLDLSVPCLRVLAYGGATMPQRVIEHALLAWPHVGFVNAYGLTETSSTITVLGPDEHRAALQSSNPDQHARLSSAGRAVPGIELEIRSADGAAVTAGVSGRIWVRGAQVSAEYAGHGPMVDERGFFDTRDRGRLDEEGYLFVDGREDDTIIRGAENIAPAEVEVVLLSHPDVLDAVVVGIPDEEWGQRLEAVIVLSPGSSADGETVRHYVRGKLRRSKTPDRIECWPDLPRTPTGKLLRRDVVHDLMQHGDAELPRPTPHEDFGGSQSAKSPG